jgi:bifunctional oligoribonuclease and PAP phosphatase NrnA
MCKKIFVQKYGRYMVFKQLLSIKVLKIRNLRLNNQSMESYFSTDQKQLAKFQDLLSNAQNIIVTSHQNPDGDAFGSGLSMTLLLQKITKAKVTFISPTDYASYISWMPAVDQIKVYNTSLDEQIKKADLIFCCDFSSVSRLKDMQTAVLAAPCPKIILDHHEQPEGFAEYLFWNQKASSTCELVFKFITDLGYEAYLDQDIATCIYTGLLTDTGSFRFNSTTSQVHLVVAKLLDFGVNPSEIHRKLFDQNNIDRLRMLGYVFSNKMVHLPEYRIIYFTISEAELKEFNSKGGDTEGIVNYGLSIENVVMAAIFIEKDGIIKISFRSIHDFSVAELARENFEGGGHKNAAGGRSIQSMQETIEKFLTLLPNYKNSLLIQEK